LQQTVVLIRRREVQRRTGLSKTQIMRLEEAGKFPAKVQLGLRAVGYIEDEVTGWIRDRIKAGSRHMATAAVAAA
jgi:prophage regulatory protein